MKGERVGWEGGGGGEGGKKKKKLRRKLNAIAILAILLSEGEFLEKKIPEVIITVRTASPAEGEGVGRCKRKVFRKEKV